MFGKDKRELDGLRCMCKSCCRKINKVYRLGKAESLESTIRRRWLDAKANACKLKLPFDITYESLLQLYWYQGGKCAVSKLVLLFPCQGVQIANIISLDRIKPELGYVDDNVRFVTKLYNWAKNKFEDGDVMQLARAMVAVADAEQCAECVA